MKVGKKVYPDKKEPANGLMKRQNLVDGQVVSHKYHRGVTGEIKIMHGDFHVKWSNNEDAGYVPLHSGDVG